MASAGRGQPSVPQPYATIGYIGVIGVVDDKRARRSNPFTPSVPPPSATIGVIEVLDDKRARRSNPITPSVPPPTASIGVVEVLDDKRVRRSSPITRSVPPPPATIGVIQVLDGNRVRRSSSPVKPSVPRPSGTIGVIEVLDDRRVHRSSPITVEDYAGAIAVEDYAEAIAVEYYAEEVLLQRSIAASMASSVHSAIDVDRTDVDVRVVEDQKGKGIQQYSGKAQLGSLTPPIIERGESSSTRRLGHPLPMGTLASPLPLLPTALCAICMEDKLLSECCSMKGCTHLFCCDCVSQYVAAKVQENVIAIKCPQPDCKDGSLEPEICRPFLPVEVFDEWCTALCEALFMGDMRFYCPFKDCSALLIDESASSGGGEKVDVIRHSECPHCHRLFCAQCKVPWHIGVTCDVFQSLGADEREREDILLMEMAKKSKWQRCLKCKFFVERTEGCMFMQCRLVKIPRT